jgi:hypothetical protein
MKKPEAPKRESPRRKVRSLRPSKHDWIRSNLIAAWKCREWYFICCQQPDALNERSFNLSLQLSCGSSGAAGPERDHASAALLAFQKQKAGLAQGLAPRFTLFPSP